MKFLVLILCLLSERFLTHHLSDRRFFWFGSYAEKISEQPFYKNISTNPWLMLGVIISPLFIVTAIIFFLFHHWFYGLVGFVFNVVILFYCLGPQNPFYPVDSDELAVDDGIGHYFYNVNRQLFAPVFWFILGGPLGVLFYRLVTLCQSINFIGKEAKILTDTLEWLPVRLTALLFLLVGNFQNGLVPFKQLFFSDISKNYELLSSSGLAALKTNPEDTCSVPLAENVVEQALIVLLVILAVCVIVPWL